MQRIVLWPWSGDRDLDCRRIDLTIGEKQHWGQGIGTKVVRLLTEFGFLKEKVDVIYEPGIADYNARSLKAFERVGYELISRIKEEPGSKANYTYDLVLTKEKFFEGLPGPPGGEAKLS